jgi:hypothetical protein
MGKLCKDGVEEKRKKSAKKSKVPCNLSSSSHYEVGLGKAKPTNIEFITNFLKDY